MAPELRAVLSARDGHQGILAARRSCLGTLAFGSVLFSGALGTLGAGTSVVSRRGVRAVFW